MKIKIFIAGLLFLLVGKISFGQNPIVQTNYTADAASLVYEDRFYIFVGRDEGAVEGGWFNMKEWRIYSSQDMVNWTDHGAKLRPLDFEWSNGDAWASHCTHHDGKFYWYVSANHKTIPGKAIGVAVSDNILGPYVDLLGEAIITNDMTPDQGDFDDIDPAVFVDDDGQAYMYWGNGYCKYVKLNEDMMTFSGEINYVDVSHFGEAPWLHKHNGVYYLSYSSGHPSTIDYSTSNSPIGPWTYGGRILDPVDNCTTSHQAISQFNNQWYFVYHNGTLPKGGNHRRSICVEEFTYNEDGTIPKLTSTVEGVQTALSNLNPYDRVEAETIAWSEGLAAKESHKVGVYISDIDNNDYLKVRAVDFGEKGASSFVANVASNSSGGTIEIRLDAIDGNIIGTLQVPYAGGWDEWILKTTNIRDVKGVYDLYMIFKGEESSNQLFNFDFWQFKKNED